MCFVFLEDPRSQTGPAAGAAGRGQTAQGRHRPARCHHFQGAGAIADDRGVRRLRLLHQHEGEADCGLARDRRQDQTGRGAAGGAQGYARAERVLTPFPEEG